jgi:hypothetical protein
MFILTAHLLVTLAKLARPGGLRAVAAESLAVKHGRVAFFTIFSGYQPPAPKLQHIR